MRSGWAASLILLAAAALPVGPAPPAPPALPPALPPGLPLPPIPPPGADEPPAAAAARQALQGVEQNRAQALAAADAAAKAAVAAAAQRAELKKARAATTERLRLAETATEQAALQLDQLARERDAARASLALSAREFAPYLPVIERLSLDPAATLLAVPAPPAQALRGLLVLQAIATGVEREAKALRADEARVDAITAKITRAETRLKAAKAEQAAEGTVLDEEITATRTAEQAAISQRAEAEATAADAAARAKTLQGAIAAIIEAARQAAAARQAEAARRQEQLALARPEVPTVAPPPLAPPPPPPPWQPSPGQPSPGQPPGQLPPKRAPGAPVVGELVSRFGAETPAGPAPGIRYQAAPGAHVLAPCAGAVEFAAPFHSYGQVVILDCGESYRIVLAGMDRLLVRSGMEVSAGEAVGVMAEWNPGSSEPRPTLYLELHHGSEVINPLPWLHGRG